MDLLSPVILSPQDQESVFAQRRTLVLRLQQAPSRVDVAAAALSLFFSKLTGAALAFPASAVPHARAFVDGLVPADLRGHAAIDDLLAAAATLPGLLASPPDGPNAPAPDLAALRQRVVQFLSKRSGS